MKSLFFLGAIVCFTLFHSPIYGQSDFIASPVYISNLVDTVGSQKYRVHIVESGHTLYSICKVYNCDKQSVIKDSPDLDVKIGEPIYIPYNKKPKLEGKEEYYLYSRPLALVQKNEQVVEIETAELIEKASIVIDNGKKGNNKTNDTVRISLLMPLHLSEDSSSFSRSYAYISFLEGILCAWKEYSQKVPVSIKIFDVTNQKESVIKALSDSYMSNTDIIIGTVYTKVFDTLQSFAKNNNIVFIHPLTEQDSMAEGNNLYIQASPSYISQANLLSDFILKNFPQNIYKYIVFNDSISFNTKRSNLLYRSLLHKGGDSNRISHYVMNHARIDALSHLNNKEKYIFCGYTDKEIILLNSLISLKKANLNGTAFIGPARWMSFSKIEPDYFKKIRYICFTPFYADRHAEYSLSFEKLYYELYGVLPGDLAFRGYTCFKWISEKIERHGLEFINSIKQSKGIIDNEFPESMYNWEQRPLGGYENKYLPLLELNNSQYKQIQ